MKYALNFGRACGALLAAALCAIAFTATASAADLTHSFKADNDKVFQTSEDVVRFTCSSGQIIITHLNSAQFYYPDATGAVCTKLKLQPDLLAEWVLNPSAPNDYFKATWTDVSCISSQTYIGYTWNGSPLVLSDGCQLHALIKAKSN